MGKVPLGADNGRQAPETGATEVARRSRHEAGAHGRIGWRSGHRMPNAVIKGFALTDRES